MYQIKHTSRRRHLYMKKEIYQPSQGYPGKPQYGLFLNHKKKCKTKERGKKGSGWPTLLLLCTYTYVKAVVPKTCQNKYRLTG